MLDVKILAIKDLLPVSSIAYAQGISPPSLTITGQNFGKAIEVLINDLNVPADGLIVLSNNQILAQIPKGQENSQIRKISVFATAARASASSVLHFEVGNSFKSLSGIEKLVQVFVKLLMQTPGSNFFRPQDGGGLLTFIGRNVEANSSQRLTQGVVQCISRARDQLLSIQQKNNRIPADERLLSVTVTQVGFNPSSTTVAAVLMLTSVAGTQAITTLLL